jgi:glycosyltransferase involved in cell wall biosynthesis
VKIRHVSAHLPPDQAANAILPASLGAWSATRGHDVGFVAHDPVQGRPAEALGLPVTRVPWREAAPGLARLLRVDAIRSARQIERTLDQVAGEADLVHLHSNGLLVEVAAAWARRRRKPHVLTLYGTEIWHYRRRWPIDPFTRAYRGASAVTFYSQGLLDRARGLGLERAGLTVIYPPVGEAFQPVDEDTRAAWRKALGIVERLVILNVKRLHELAGQRDLLDAFAAATRRRRDVRLVICGTGPLRAALDARVQELGLSDRVTLTGLVSHTDVARYMAVADVFVLPSLLEALPTVAVEALAAGTPVVSADHPGGLELSALVGDDVVVVPRRDVDRLAKAMTAAIERPARTRAATRQIVADRFGSTAVASAYHALYDTLASGQAAPR